MQYRFRPDMNATRVFATAMVAIDMVWNVSTKDGHDKITLKSGPSAQGIDE
jgi:hypothetical protein